VPETTRPIEVPDCAHRPTDVQVYPYYRVYASGDGYLCIAALSRGLREKLCAALEITDADVGVDLGNISDETYYAHKPLMRLIEARLLPVRFSQTPARPGRGAPTLGQDSERVLLDFGWSAEEIGRLKQEAIVK
jgi:crotonobetainyl-CoA:carnitine CoA-transferase CaiB-like acyl-CoA transferase